MSNDLVGFPWILARAYSCYFPAPRYKPPTRTTRKGRPFGPEEKDHTSYRDDSARKLVFQHGPKAVRRELPRVKMLVRKVPDCRLRTAKSSYRDDSAVSRPIHPWHWKDARTEQNKYARTSVLYGAENCLGPTYHSGPGQLEESVPNHGKPGARSPWVNQTPPVHLPRPVLVRTKNQSRTHILDPSPGEFEIFLFAVTGVGQTRTITCPAYSLLSHSAPQRIFELGR
ncbi:hypothetical protein BJ875DRAFT_438205 [Amylocarpus encephaloides]|uniref:Uncharacterized protein n=1 Tax=Amylocarpus encephaloides TaxID=45428 RepID=A0A9P8CA08_9HELO|nr:hypothetical protein BJ875DRAFT_438205 [Amylocarpus encephaloides]